MKYLFIFLITIYQIFISPFLKQMVGVSRSCRYTPTCSELAKTKIKEYGIIRGGKIALKQLMTCHPFAKTYGRTL